MSVQLSQKTRAHPRGKGVCAEFTRGANVLLKGNKLLELLGPGDQKILEPLMMERTLPRDLVLFQPGDSIASCYFPRDGAVASYFVLLQGGETVETLIIDSEGAIGGIIGNRQYPAFARACVMGRGSFYQIASADLLQARRDSPTIDAVFTRYADCLVAQMLQSIACNASHTIEQRAAKWLCAAVDRNQHSGITMTQEQLAALMGSGRSYASRVVQRFKRDGLLQTRRGGLELLDYPGLRDRACTCNTLVRDHIDKVFGYGEP